MFLRIEAYHKPMKSNIKNDIIVIRELLGLTQTELADRLGLYRETIAYAEEGKKVLSKKNIIALYDFAYSKGLCLTKTKSLLLQDDIKGNEILLFHGSKSGIVGDIDINKGRINNDFGKGFYCGSKYEQAVSFVTQYESPVLYMMSLDDAGLTTVTFDVDRDWMLAIAYFRGTLDEYSKHPLIQSIKDKVESADIIIAPIADNRMFRIIDTFVLGEITEEQCKHCLAATDLGKQYVFKTSKALTHLKLLDECYICPKEREYFLGLKEEDRRQGDQKVRMAKIKYRGQGRYIEEILG